MPRKYLRRRRSSKSSTKRRKSKKMRGGVTVKAQDLKTRLPEDMFGEIREMHPLLTPKLTNATIKRAVRDYLNGGARKQRVVTKYGEIRNWDVSNVTDMDHMFWDAHSFNQPLNNWNVSKVTNMSEMFNGASSFNQPLHAPWYVVEQWD